MQQEEVAVDLPDCAYVLRYHSVLSLKPIKNHSKAIQLRLMFAPVLFPIKNRPERDLAWRAAAGLVFRLTDSCPTTKRCRLWLDS